MDGPLVYEEGRKKGRIIRHTVLGNQRKFKDTHKIIVEEQKELKRK